MKRFPCTKCGCCCRMVGEAIRNGLVFEYGVKEDGSCEKLTEDNMCSVYEGRPSICNIETQMTLNRVTRKKYYRASMDACNQLIDKFNVSPSYRINKI